GSFSGTRPGRRAMPSLSIRGAGRVALEAGVLPRSLPRSSPYQPPVPSGVPVGWRELRPGSGSGDAARGCRAIGPVGASSSGGGSGGSFGWVGRPAASLEMRSFGDSSVGILRVYRIVARVISLRHQPDYGQIYQ